MKIKRFFAPDIRDAIRQVRAEQGPDAVILSNTQVDGGVEIVAAVDYDENLVNGLMPHAPAPKRADRDGDSERGVQAPVDGPAPDNFSEALLLDEDTALANGNKIVWSQEPTLVAMRNEIDALRGLLEEQLSGLAWGSMAQRHPVKTRLLRALLEVGFSPRLCQEVAEQVSDNREFARAQRLAFGILAHRLTTIDSDITNDARVVALIGPTGVGKTTTLFKLATRHLLRYGPRSVGVITTDADRLGACEQLRTFARVLDIPLRVATHRKQLMTMIQSMGSKSLVLVDTIGVSQRGEDLRTQLELFSGLPENFKRYLVLSAATETMVLYEVAKSFGRIDLAGCVITKLDEAARLGGTLSVLIENELPVAFISDGQRVPDDLHTARPHDLISRCIMLSRAANRPQSSRDDDKCKTQASKLARRVAMASAFEGRLSSAHI
ncbi:MAG: flagellar biosynthesis protein FlhF [Gammaproteobacteria bacterium]|nr:flagellar biosynthesis protein FlhF [Gammaproteobacteria bacterium]